MSTYDKKLSREEFLRIRKLVPKVAAPPGKANWKEIFAELEKTNEPLTVEQIQTHYVKDVVIRYRTLNVLKQAAAQGKCLQIWYDGRYWFLFGERPEGAENLPKEPPKRGSKKK